MSYQALARKYRPQTFDDILGQPAIVRTLTNAIRDGRIHQAYLFSGVRGVGKTTTARILAKAINCVNGPTPEPCNECTICREITEGIDLDVREIDAATYTQVENIRELREVTQFQPARDRRRIFIIDEAHMLSSSAWNALLKLIEEPPPHVSFIMATTEMHKVPATILSRVQQLVFRKITASDVADRLEEICRRESIDASRDALEMVARRGDGSVRDALSVLDQVVAFSGANVTASDVATILGLADGNFFSRVVSEIHAGNHAALFETLEEAAESGRDFKLLYRDLLHYLRNVLLACSDVDERLFSVDGDALQSIRNVASQFRYTDVLRILNVLMQDEDLIQNSEHQRLAVEISVLKAATFPRLVSVEQAIGGGGSAARPQPVSPAQGRPATTGYRASITGEPSAAKPGDLKESVIREVRSRKAVAAGYLEEASRTALEGDTLTFWFDDAHGMLLDYFASGGTSDLVRDAASRVAGRPIRVAFERLSAAPDRRRDEPKTDEPAPSPLRSDPVLQAFEKHLGGEVIPPRGH